MYLHWLNGRLVGEEYESIRATPHVDPSTGKVYVVMDESYDSHEFEGGAAGVAHPGGLLRVWSV